MCLSEEVGVSLCWEGSWDWWAGQQILRAEPKLHTALGEHWLGPLFTQNVGKETHKHLGRIWCSTAQHWASIALADGFGILRSSHKKPHIKKIVKADPRRKSLNNTGFRKVQRHGKKQQPDSNQIHINIGTYKGCRLKRNSPSPLLKSWLLLKHLKEVTYFVFLIFYCSRNEMVVKINYKPCTC